MEKLMKLSRASSSNYVQNLCADFGVKNAVNHSPNAPTA
jgi:hypothetical protein